MERDDPPIAEFAASKDVTIAIEGWPGPGPAYPALGCTPEMWRAMFEACPSPGLGLNYDPSHLVRIGIDYLRALNEFAPRTLNMSTVKTLTSMKRHSICTAIWDRASVVPAASAKIGGVIRFPVMVLWTG